MVLKNAHIYYPLQLKLGSTFLENNKIIGEFTMLKTLREQRTINAVTLHVTLNVIQCAQTKTKQVLHVFPL